jgi:hypothetical protein
MADVFFLSFGKMTNSFPEYQYWSGREAKSRIRELTH